MPNDGCVCSPTVSLYFTGLMLSPGVEITRGEDPRRNTSKRILVHNLPHTSNPPAQNASRQNKFTSLPRFVVRWVRSEPLLVLKPFKFKFEWIEMWFSTFILFFESLLSRTLDHFSVAYQSIHRSVQTTQIPSGNCNKHKWTVNFRTSHFQQ